MMGIPLMAGPLFNDSEDTASAPWRVIVNQAWVKRNFPGEDPIGKRIKFTYSTTQPFREIVGVVGDIADAGLDSPYEPILFAPCLQDVGPFITYMVRTAGEPGGAVRSAIRNADPRLILIRPVTMDQIIAQSPSVFLRRYPSFLIGSFAVLALILAMVGLYGLISYSVSQRTREVGIRIALGAQPRDVMRLVVGEGARLTMVGVGVGVFAALGLTQLMRSLLFGVSAVDPLTFATGALLLALVATAACYILPGAPSAPIPSLLCVLSRHRVLGSYLPCYGRARESAESDETAWHTQDKHCATTREWPRLGYPIRFWADTPAPLEIARFTNTMSKVRA
jgi:putative ABC transport system permease protein